MGNLTQALLEKRRPIDCAVLDEPVVNRVDRPIDDLTGKRACRRALREEVGLERDPKAPLCGMVSRVTSQKGLDLVGSLLPHLVRRGAQFVLLGSGDPAILDLFRGAVGRWPGRVALVEGYNEPLSHRVYAGSDIFVMPSRFEGLPLALLEALRAGLACCASRTSGIPEAIADGENGRLCEAGDLEGWTTTLGDLVEHPDERQRLRRELRAILAYVDQLAELDLPGHGSPSPGGPRPATVRPDEVEPSLSREAALGGARDVADARFRVPPLFE